jgi:amino acid transporter
LSIIAAAMFVCFSFLGYEKTNQLNQDIPS